MTVKGSCACGKVEYQIDGELHDASSCHCSMCRKSSGSNAMAFALFPPEKFAWVSGKDHLSHYQSSAEMGRYFCSACGSPLAGTYKGEVGWVNLGCVDETPSIRVETHIFMGSRARWETTPDEVRRYDEFPEP